MPPRRITPQLGDMAWRGDSLRAGEIMIPLGAEHAAELQAGPGVATPRLEALAADLAGRLDHRQGLALLRGLPQGIEPTLLLQRLGSQLGTPVAPEEAASGFGDVLLLQVPEPAEAVVVAAATVHNTLMAADRAALASLYEARPGTGTPVFCTHEGVFAARWHPAKEPPDTLPPAFLAAMEEAGLALRLPLQRGDVLATNPFLVWPSPRSALLPGAPRLLLQAAHTRMEAPPWRPLRRQRIPEVGG
ncbi:hypothetical protein LPC08_07445 [Roseomonas sp. OT10]|uniref:hypothetical protein n=1 Tax=Roseomonas cutis TaxID=2897332 RepID=UPI001E383B7E|nr:hypothetical protein [Roseomonas sp. OT10]UFN50443.1 hypothetical protein LPC08_07445 [Roseomonas sp. OT10]